MNRLKIVILAVAAAFYSGCSPAQAEPNLLNELELLAAEQNPEALYHLGMMHLLGAGVERDQEGALEYFRRSATLGDPLAAYKLGCFYDGQYDLLEINLDLALKHKLVAAEAGYALAQQDVALLLYKEGDVVGAQEWLKKAADQGSAGALQAYASIHNGAEDIEKDPVKTAAYFTIYLKRHQGSEAQKDWLRSFVESLTPEQVEETNNIVSQYRATPTPITIKALSGMKAAERLVATS